MRRTFFITLNWNTTNLYKDMITSVEIATPEPHTWITVDNGSNDDQWHELKLWAQAHSLHNDANGSLIRFPENRGLILAHNRALEIARLSQQPFDTLLINTDVTVSERGWLTRMLQWADKRPHAAIIGLEHNEANQCASAIFLDTCGNWYIHPDQPTRAIPTRGESVGFGMVFIRWQAWKSGLMFDPLYEMYYKQDDDLAFRARATGLEAWAFPIGCNHWGSGSIKTNGPPGGKEAFEAIKRENQRRFAERWAFALRPRRTTLAAEQDHLDDIQHELTIGARQRGLI